MTIAEIVGHPYFTLSLAIVAIFGLVLTIVFYRRSRRQKKPLFEIARRNLIQNNTPLISGLSVHFNGQEQKMITVVHVWFWNQGNETINSSDIPEAKPVLIRINPGVKLLDVQVIKVVDEANRCAIEKPMQEKDGSHVVPLRFDYLDKGDGMAVQIVHNGDASHRIKVEGKIKGVEAIAKAADAYAFHIEQRIRITDTMAFMDNPKMAGVVTILVMAGAGVALVSQSVGTNGKWYLWIPAVFCFLMAAICYPIYLRHLIPKKLDIEFGTAQPSSAGDAETSAPEK